MLSSSQLLVSALVCCGAILSDASITSFQRSLAEDISDRSTRSGLIVRRDGRSHESKNRDRSNMNASSLIETRGPVFPAYPRADSYAHPLDAAGQDMEKKVVARITPDGVMGHLKELVEFPTRSFSNLKASQKVEHHLKDKLTGMGYTTCFHNFNDAGDVEFTNIVAYKQGTNAHSTIVGAHYDSRPFDGSAPGAEDNGSGVASMLAMAQAYADAKIKPKSSVYFVAFAGEEPGLIGSKHFAEALHAGGGAIPAECKASSSFLQMSQGAKAKANHQAIIMDEVGWASPALSSPTVNLESYDWTKPVMDHMRESSHTHNGDAITVVHSNHPFGSDHMSFLDKDMMAVLTINGDDEAYPHYHQSSDTIENVNPQLLSMITKMNLGALIRMTGVDSK